MNLSSKEIANILNISSEGVKKARQRLRKKLSLTPGDSLEGTDVNATITFAKCNHNGTAGNTMDDFQMYQVSATHSGSGTQYEVVINLGLASEMVLATANYGTTILVGNAGQMHADGSSTYTLTVRDITDTNCQQSIIVSAISPCSSCPPINYIPITAVKKLG